MSLIVLGNELPVLARLSDIIACRTQCCCEVALQSFHAMQSCLAMLRQEASCMFDVGVLCKMLLVTLLSCSGVIMLCKGVLFWVCCVPHLFRLQVAGVPTC